MIHRLKIHQSELPTVLLSRLRGQVFHVTQPMAFESIQKTGYVLVDPPPVPGVKRSSYDAYFPSVGCLCICDLRGIDDDKLSMALDAYLFVDPWHGDPDPVFLFLRDEALTSLITYDEAKESGAVASGKMIAPFIEAGHRGDLPVELIAEALLAEIERPPDGPHLAALKALGGPP